MALRSKLFGGFLGFLAGWLTLACSTEIQGEATARGECFTQEERRLFELINTYRADHDLPAIPPSPSLTLVAHRHAEDLGVQGRLTHGWSDCDYQSGKPSTYPCMWEAPQRLNTSYPGNGYENAHWHSAQATPESALESWKTSPPHRQVILNQGPWNQDWKALGVAIQGNFAVLWVGHEVDPVPPCR